MPLQFPRICWRRFLCSFLLASVFSDIKIWEVEAHVAAWHKGMYCLNGTQAGQNDQNTNAACQPLYQLNQSDWWFHHSNNCDEFPPADGDFLELPANGQFTVEHAVNRAFTTLSFGGRNTALFGDGKNHPGLGKTLDGKAGPDSCITEPNIHTQNETMAAGTIFAISYNSNLSQVTPENLVVFTVLKNTPWRRLATYKVPNLPACPDPGGGICAWGWVANGCGEPNMYMFPYRCRVVGHTGDAAVAPGVPPVWCEDDKSKCVSGPKQMVFYNQLEGNNVQVSGYDLAGQPRAPTYNSKMGFSNGAQTDIFHTPGSATPTYVKPAPTPTLSADARRTTTIPVGMPIWVVWLSMTLGFFAAICI
ncbi:hypothetical protein M413DRAFT_449921 [Hebeloma cylindrosporum]|uniref:Lytic polysaccharide monooxygenase n=1 Tax=Hebeloma cylindrosporum TaxID=76867 RepID=A0A0C2XAM9_HEBCY|nr:hypothetical protein M413DRAFT_449921 [Hebeloma cylindrosporum h7]